MEAAGCSRFISIAATKYPYNEQLGVEKVYGASQSITVGPARSWELERDSHNTSIAKGRGNEGMHICMFPHLLVFSSIALLLHSRGPP